MEKIRWGGVGSVENGQALRTKVVISALWSLRLLERVGV